MGQFADVKFAIWNVCMSTLYSATETAPSPNQDCLTKL